MELLKRLTDLYLNMRSDGEVPITASCELLSLLKLELLGVLKADDVTKEVGEQAISFELVEGSCVGVDAERRKMLECYLSKSEMDIILGFVQDKIKVEKIMEEI